MKRYNLQEGDGVHVYHDADLMLVMNGGRPALSDFDSESVRLEFHWNWVDYPVRRDEIGFTRRWTTTRGRSCKARIRRREE